MAVLTVQNVAPIGLTPAMVAADVAGDSFANTDGKTFLIIKNGSAASIDVTINSVKPCDQGFDHDQVVTVPAGGERWIGPFAQSRWNDSSGRVNVSYSAVATITVGAVHV